MLENLLRSEKTNWVQTFLEYYKCPQTKWNPPHFVPHTMPVANIVSLRGLVVIFLRCCIFINLQIKGITILSVPMLYLWQGVFFHLHTYLWIQQCTFDLWCFRPLYILTAFPVSPKMTLYQKKNLVVQVLNLTRKRNLSINSQFLQSQPFSGAINTAEMFRVCSSRMCTAAWRFGIPNFYLTHSFH